MTSGSTLVFLNMNHLSPLTIFDSCCKLSVIITSGGSFDSYQTVPGQIANFNMWQREMTLDELNYEGCETKGDVVSSNTLQENGVSNRAQKEFPACSGKKMFKLLKSLVVPYDSNI